jgi:phage portal protein BeeE
LHFHALLLEIFRLCKFGVDNRFFGFPPLRAMYESFRLLGSHADVHSTSKMKKSTQ